MNPIVSVENGTTFDVTSVVRELREEDQYGREGQAARTLVRTSDLRLLVVALRAGKTISEHHAKATASLQSLTGRIRVRLPEQQVDLTEGQLLVMGAALPHEVHSETDSAFLLTLGWSVPGDSKLRHDAESV